MTAVDSKAGKPAEVRGHGKMIVLLRLWLICFIAQASFGYASASEQPPAPSVVAGSPASAPAESPNVAVPKTANPASVPATSPKTAEPASPAAPSTAGPPAPAGSSPVAPPAAPASAESKAQPAPPATNPCGERAELPADTADLRGQIAFGTYLLPGGEKAELTVYPPAGTAPSTYDIRVFARPAAENGAPVLLPTLGTGPAKADPKGQSVWIRAPANPSAHWQSHQFFAAACKDGKLAFLATTEVEISSRASAIWLTLAIVVGTYLLVSWIVCRIRHIGWTRDPVKWAAVEQGRGRGSLAILQTIWFTNIVYALVIYYLLRLGSLGDLSADILWLLGIPLVGTTLARAIDAVKQRLTPENYTWIVTRGWITKPEFLQSSRWRNQQTSDHNQNVVDQARFGDVFFEAGRFEPTKYQAVIFSVVVGGALLLTGFDKLATFEIPDAYLVLMGGSQGLYILGKHVAPDRFHEASGLLDAARKSEDDLRKAAAAKNIITIADAEKQLPLEYARAKEAIDLAATRIERLFALGTIDEEKRKPSI